MVQLYAVCRPGINLEVKHIQLTNDLQGELDGIFQAQEASFLANIDNEIDFTGDWTPDNDELLVINNLPETQILVTAVNQNALALPALDVANFAGENIKALFTSAGTGTNRRFLVQYFSPQQLLSRSISALYNGDVFRRLTEPAFSLGIQLVAIINNAGVIKFKSYSILRRIFDVGPIFREATDIEMNIFCGHASISVEDTATFVADADEGIRKLVHAVQKVDVLGNHTVDEIQLKADTIGFQLGVVDNAISVPADRKSAKELFSFLLNKVYLGPIDEQLFITNSNRPLG